MLEVWQNMTDKGKRIVTALVYHLAEFLVCIALNVLHVQDQREISQNTLTSKFLEVKIVCNSKY